MSNKKKKTALNLRTTSNKLQIFKHNLHNNIWHVNSISWGKCKKYTKCLRENYRSRDIKRAAVRFFNFFFNIFNIVYIYSPSLLFCFIRDHFFACKTSYFSSAGLYYFFSFCTDSDFFRRSHSIGYCYYCAIIHKRRNMSQFLIIFLAFSTFFHLITCDG